MTRIPYILCSKLSSFCAITYKGFSNAIQYPGLINIAAQNGCLGKTPNLVQKPPTIYDYFGYGMSNLLDVRTDPNSRRNNFDILNPRDSDKNERCKSLFQSEPKPRFFFIESRLAKSRYKRYKGKVGNSVDHSFDEHYVAVVYKDEYYYICPGEENSLIYRVGCPNRIFLTEDGHAVLSVILKQSLGSDVALNRFRLLIPKLGITNSNSTIDGVGNWDRTSKYEIEFHMPFPVSLASAAVNYGCHSSVQVVTLKDDEDFIRDIVIDGREFDGSDDEGSTEEDMEDT